MKLKVDMAEIEESKIQTKLLDELVAWCHKHPSFAVIIGGSGARGASKSKKKYLAYNEKPVYHRGKAG